MVFFKVTFCPFNSFVHSVSLIQNFQVLIKTPPINILVNCVHLVSTVTQHLYPLDKVSSNLSIVLQDITVPKTLQLRYSMLAHLVHSVV